MRSAFDTITDWIGIPLFLVSILLLVHADLIAVRTPGQERALAYLTSRQAGLIVAAAALMLTLVRFAVLSTA
jgi:formate hydrogenlyase subunit 3/multisubunit Na+/H+ antiporter MnhD subunit